MPQEEKAISLYPLQQMGWDGGERVDARAWNALYVFVDVSVNVNFLNTHYEISSLRLQTFVANIVHRPYNGPLTEVVILCSAKYKK